MRVSCGEPSIERQDCSAQSGVMTLKLEVPVGTDPALTERLADSLARP
jgi:hypothetical protein